MLTPVLPSIRALCSPDDRLMDEELRVLALRQQAVRAGAFLAEVPGLVPSTTPPPANDDLAEELTRLGGVLLDVATVVGAKAGPPGGVILLATAG